MSGRCRRIRMSIRCRTSRSEGWYCSFDYAEARDVSRDVLPLDRAIQRWQAEFETSFLFSVDKGAELSLSTAATWWRPAAGGTRNLQRTLYLGLRPYPRRSGAPAECGASLAELDEALSSLVARGLMLREGDQVLSLDCQQQCQSQSRAGPQN